MGSLDPGENQIVELSGTKYDIDQVLAVISNHDAVVRIGEPTAKNHNPLLHNAVASPETITVMITLSGEFIVALSAHASYDVLKELGVVRQLRENIVQKINNKGTRPGSGPK